MKLLRTPDKTGIRIRAAAHDPGRHRRSLIASALVLVLGACSSTRLAELPTAEDSTPEPVAEAATPAATANSIWGGVYSEVQARRGHSMYLRACAECHRPDLTGMDMAPALLGTAFNFRWRGESVGDIYSTVRNSMPPVGPGTLSDQIYIDVVAYLLSVNEFPPGDQELAPSPTALSEIKIERKTPNARPVRRRRGCCRSSGGAPVSGAGSSSW